MLAYTENPSRVSNFNLDAVILKSNVSLSYEL